MNCCKSYQSIPDDPRDVNTAEPEDAETLCNPAECYYVKQYNEFKEQIKILKEQINGHSDTLANADNA